MRHNTPHTRDLIKRLYEPVRSWEQVAQLRNYEPILTEIGNSDEAAAIIDILPLTLSGLDIAFAAAAAIHKILLGTTPTDLAWLDSEVRQRSSFSGEYFYVWYRLSSDQIHELQRFGDASVSLLGLASFDRSGYVREAAIKKLSLVTTGAEIPFLLLRLNDWVSQVRESAYEAIWSRIKPEYCRAFIANHSLLTRLEHAERADHQETIDAINRLLQSDECRTTLLECLNSEDRLTRRASFRLALESPKSDLQQVVQQALNNHDTVVRHWGAQTISSAFEGETLEHFLELMKRDRFMPVRREALRSHHEPLGH